MMMKKILVFLLLVMSLGAMSFSEETYTVFYNNHKADIPLFLEDAGPEIFVSLEDFATTIQAQFTLDFDGSKAILYRSNTFAKFYLDRPLVQINGKSFEMPRTAVVTEEKMWVPLRFIAPYFNIDLTLDEEGREIRMTDQVRATYRTYQNYFYQKTQIPEYNISFDLPYYWRPLSEEAYLYGRDNAYEEILMEVKMIRNLARIDLTQFTQDLKRSLYYRFIDSDLKISAEENLTLSGFEGRMIRYTLTVDSEPTSLIYYITKVNDLFYEMVFQFPLDDANYQLETVGSILGSFEVKTFAINTLDEHYVEFAKYHELHLAFTEELYSNRQVAGTLPLEGTCDPDVSKIYVTIEKGPDRFNQVIPVKEGTFEGEIPLPFGLGYHAVTLSGSVDSSRAQHLDLKTPSDLILKVSLINLSDDFIRYSLPEPGIPSDHPHIVTMGRLITRDTLTDYQRTYKLYTYFLESLQTDGDSGIQSAYEVYLHSKGHPTAVVKYFASLLRSLGIPARVLRGDFEGLSHTWTEVYLNGGWWVVDILKGMDSGDRYSYFLLPPGGYDSTYENITSLTQ